MSSTKPKRVKENRSDWVAVESDVQGVADGSKIKPAKTPFAFFRDDELPRIRQAIEASGGKFELGQAQKELSDRWHNLSEEDKEPFIQLAANDKQRYDEECAQRDAEVAEAQEKKRQERELVETGERLRHKKVDVSTSQPVPRAKRELTEEQLQAKLEREERKKALEDSINNEREELAKEKAKAASDRLKYLLQQADIFSHFGVGKTAVGSPRAKKVAKKKVETPKLIEPGSPRHRLTEREEDSALLHDDVSAKTPVRLERQPKCIENGTMRAYQIEGLNWMISLAERGINGILADEMGLGKTLQSLNNLDLHQTISILGYTHEFKHVNGPHIILSPKSTLSNWMNELRKWCPVLRAVKFHGDKEERQRIVTEILRPGHKDRKYDVVVTSFEMCIKEKSTLQKIAWRYLVIDEAHRIKNEASTFSQVVRTFHTHHRLLLTGTPLQNNLHELWALLNFLLPDVFSSSEQFDDWFNLDIDDDETKQTLISQLHKILRPFMLRRLKVDVEKSLPPKKEILLFVGMSSMQKQLYKSILLRDMDAIAGGNKNTGRTALLNVMMQLRKCCNHPYLFEGQEDRTLDPMGSHLIENCGKMVLLDKLLVKLKERGSRVLIFSQMTRVLDIFEDYCHIRNYQYCRIDGQTSYEDREASIEAYNKPDSEKFIFLLSTRAGGLGINLYTADIVILYDSDWNPQADLQAQDRAHRIGQKKPVFVYRLVTNQTIEEKIIERAQQKLKLDAVVVQQGRLSDKQKNLSKEEMLEMIRFGAEHVFRSKDGDITEDDIDAILAQGEARTEEMNEKLEKHVKGDLLNFKMDGGLSVQEFEGVDYSDKNAREQEMKRLMEQELAMAMAEGIGKRERRPVTNYNENHYYRQVGASSTKKRKSMVRKEIRLPRMDEWQFYNKQRLEEIQEIEKLAWEEAKELPSAAEQAARAMELIPEEVRHEKERLLDQGFHDWTKANFNAFIKLCARHGRNSLDAIARDLEKPEEEVKRYAKAFWSLGPKTLSNWDNIIKIIEKGESRLLEIKKLVEATTEKISRFDNPWERMTFMYQGKAGKSYTEEEDRYLLCFAHRYGYGEWDKVKAAINRCDRFRFDYILRSRTAQDLGRRCDLLMRLSEKENAEANKKLANEREVLERLKEERNKLEERRKNDEELLKKKQEEITKRIQEEADRIQAEKEAKRKKQEQGQGQDGGKDLKKGVPSALLPSLLQAIIQLAEQPQAMIVKKFCTAHPEVSQRQVAAKISEVAVKEKRSTDTPQQWYIRAEYEEQIPPKMKKRLAEGGDVRPAKKSKTPSKSGDKGGNKKDKGEAKTPSKPKKRQGEEEKPKSSSKKPKSSKSTPKAAGAEPRRPRSAMILFSLANRQAAKAALPPDSSTALLMKKLTEMWKDLDEDAKKKWEDEALEDLHRYEREMAAYQGVEGKP